MRSSLFFHKFLFIAAMLTYLITLYLLPQEIHKALCIFYHFVYIVSFSLLFKRLHSTYKIVDILFSIKLQLKFTFSILYLFILVNSIMGMVVMVHTIYLYNSLHVYKSSRKYNMSRIRVNYIYKQTIDKHIYLFVQLPMGVNAQAIFLTSLLKQNTVRHERELKLLMWTFISCIYVWTTFYWGRFNWKTIIFNAPELSKCVLLHSN